MILIVEVGIWKQDCVIQSTAENWGAIAAHHRNSPYENTGFSFVNCTIRGTGEILLGRAWGDYSRAIYSYCDMDNIISSSGWSDWRHPSRQRYNLKYITKIFLIDSKMI